MRLSRRTALRILAGIGAAVGGTACASAATTQPAADRRLGAEWEKHARTFMTWPTTTIWAGEVGGVRSDIAGLARAIAGYEAPRAAAESTAPPTTNPPTDGVPPVRGKPVRRTSHRRRRTSGSG